MIKIIFCLRRLASLSQEHFIDYWYNKHAPLVRKHQKALRILRYVQNVPAVPELARGMQKARGAPMAYDGVAELWFASAADIEAGRGDPAAAAAGRELLEDERRFIDLANSPLWYNEERAIIR